MREQLNKNPLVQAAVIGVLLLGAGFFLLSSGGGDDEAEPGSGVGEAALGLEASPGATAASATVAVSAPAPPPGVVSAYEADRIVVLLFVRDGAIDDRLVVKALAPVRLLPGVSTFVVPASRIARYAAIAQGVAVNRVPALVVIGPKSKTGGVPTASVRYGYQSPQSVHQAVIDAGYDGPTRAYHP